MVTVEAVRRLKKAQPFRPFRVHLQDGRVYEVRYPRITLVSDAALTIGFLAPGDPDPDPGVYDTTVSVPYWYITKVELVEEPAAPEAS
jgi:hypothetical protein